MTVDRLDTPIGPLTVCTDGARLLCIDFGDTVDARRAASHVVPEVADNEVCARLRAYFAGDLAAIDGIPVAPAGTEFQRAVWLALRQIPAGQTWSYTQLAQVVGAPAAVRAVGAANGANPVPLVLPCHRVIGRDGRLVGYGGGLDRKRWLLAHEGARPHRLW